MFYLLCYANINANALLHSIQLYTIVSIVLLDVSIVLLDVSSVLGLYVNRVINLLRNCYAAHRAAHRAAHQCHYYTRFSTGCVVLMQLPCRALRGVVGGRGVALSYISKAREASCINKCVSTVSKTF